MQFTSFAIMAAMASFTYAQSSAILAEQAKIPACGVTCLTTAAGIAGCPITDYTCQCGRGREAITQSAIPCVVSTCQPSDLASITQISTEICRLNALEGLSASVTSVVSGAASSLSTRIASATSVLASASTTSSAAATTRTGNAAAGNARSGVAGVAVGLGAVVAAFAL